MIGKYLNIMQIYINGKAYITSNTECDPETLIETISNSIDETCILNCHVERTTTHVSKGIRVYTIRT